MNLHLKTSLDYIRRSPFQAMAAISVLTLTFFVGTLLAILVYSSAQVIGYFETRPQIIAFLKGTATPTDIENLQGKLASDVRVRDLKYVTKEDALEIYKKATSDNPLLAELVSPTIFPASLEFSVTELSFAQSVIDEVKQDEIVESVGFTASLGGQNSVGSVIEKLKSATRYLRIGGIVLVSVLVTTSVMVLVIIIGMRIVTRRGEIETLNLIGATSGFIRAPIVWEVVVYSLIGVGIGWLLSFIAILYVTPSLIAYFGEIPVLPKDTLQFFLLLFAILLGEIVAGLMIAVLGSKIAIDRALKSK